MPVRQDLSLPPEIIDKILDEVIGLTDWKQCALVSRSWTPRCQRRIFCQISIDLDPSFMEKAVLLRNLLEESPHIPAHVQELIIREDEYENTEEEYYDNTNTDQAEGQPGQTGGNDDAEDGGNDDDSEDGESYENDSRPAFLEELVAIINLLPYLQKFFFLCLSDSCELDLELIEAVRHIPRLPHMKEIEVVGWEFPTLSSFQDFMGNDLTSLSALTLHIDIHDFPSSLSPSLGQVCPKKGTSVVLNALDLNVDYQAIDAWIGSLPHALTVKQLILRGFSDPASLMTRFSQGIEELTICGDHEDQPRIDLSRAENLTKIVFRLSLAEIFLFSDSLKTLPENNRVRTIELKNLNHDYLLDSAGWFRSLDSYLASSNFPHLTKLVLSFIPSSPPARLASFIRTNMPSTLAKNILWLRSTLDGDAEPLAPIQI
ncbi:hypothetical protein ONZ45_g14353 [Pleurotus djamor]|nr:hypothetical protein ONZ45_g14353 [Pleurotus djamor]